MDEDEQYVPLAGADWRVEAQADGSVLYVTEEWDREEWVTLAPEHVAAIASAAGRSQPEREASR